MNRMEELINASRLGELMHRQKKHDRRMVCCLGAIAVIIGIAAIVFCICKCKKPNLKCMDDLDDEFEDELEDDFFEEDIVTE